MTDDKPMRITLKRDAADAPRVQAMVVIHRIFRREFRLLADLIRKEPASDAERARARGRPVGLGTSKAMTTNTFTPQKRSTIHETAT